MLHLVPGCASWPPALDRIEGPPDELWAEGRVELLHLARKVAVVGTRAPTPYGEAQARRFASGLARCGVCVVSGLARGVDQAAHEGALDVDGATIAVLGCGVDDPWPPGPVATRVLDRGLLLSEYAPGTRPRRHHFPLRNRLISGLCDAVLVVEAAGASGSLITARWAADQGRDVFALPGRVDHPMGLGTLRLVREGACPIGSPEDLIRELYGGEFAASRSAGGPAEGAVAPGRPGSPPLPEGRGADVGATHAERALAREVLRGLVGETPTADELARRLGRSPTAVLAELVQLELAGRVVRAPGGLYRLA